MKPSVFKIVDSSLRQDFLLALRAAIPIMLGYVAIGIPCGILNASIGLGVIHVLMLSMLFYSGAGQFMLPNMYLAGFPLGAIIASISMVNMRQMLYSAALSQRVVNENKYLTFLFAATITDESFGVNTSRFNEGEWTVRRATMVNLLSMSSWTISNVIGVIVGNAISIPLAIASFAMTSIFICLAATQKINLENMVAIVMAIVGVIIAKILGFAGAAILVGAIFGVLCAFGVSSLRIKFSKGASDELG